mmetsp:Transcript_114473/g.227831  ORF Transcript_114473/g.227831 Transcript_114473/m.227831 type:complete len:293 (+) Transcript_114473:2-880(+)
MLEAQTQTVSIDRDYDAARLFLRFLYVGRFSANGFNTFQIFLDVAHLCDFYGVGEECASAFSQQEFADVWFDLWRSYVEQSSIDKAMAALKTLRPLSCCPEAMISKMFESFNVSLGSNLFTMLCHARALGVLDLISQGSQQLVWPSVPVSVWLAQEMNEPGLDSCMSSNPDLPDLLRLAFMDFIGLATAVGRVAVPPDVARQVGNVVEIFEGQQFTSGPIVQSVQGAFYFQVDGESSTRYCREHDCEHWSTRSVDAFCRRMPDMIKSVENAIAKAGKGELSTESIASSCLDC